MVKKRSSSQCVENVERPLQRSTFDFEPDGTEKINIKSKIRAHRASVQLEDTAKAKEERAALLRNLHQGKTMELKIPTAEEGTKR